LRIWDNPVRIDSFFIVAIRHAVKAMVREPLTWKSTTVGWTRSVGLDGIIVSGIPVAVVPSEPKENGTIPPRTNLFWVVR
jgi:hypothetical protein